MEKKNQVEQSTSHENSEKRHWEKGHPKMRWKKNQTVMLSLLSQQQSCRKNCKSHVQRTDNILINQRNNSKIDAPTSPFWKIFSPLPPSPFWKRFCGILFIYVACPVVIQQQRSCLPSTVSQALWNARPMELVTKQVYQPASS